MSKKLTVVIGTDFSVSLFGLSLIKLFESGVAQISVSEDIDPSTFVNDEGYCYFFAYAGTIPSGVKEIVTNLDAFPSSVNLFCCETEADKLDSCSPGGLKAPRFENGLDILNSFIKVLELVR